MNNVISLEKAKTMTALYRQQKENILSPAYQGKDILSISETFDAVPFLTVLGNPDCKGIRVYYGMSEDLKIHAIIVGVNANNEDILPATQNTESANNITGNNIVTDDDEIIIEEGQSCPPICAPPSPLNN